MFLCAFVCFFVRFCVLFLELLCFVCYLRFLRRTFLCVFLCDGVFCMPFVRFVYSIFVEYFDVHILERLDGASFIRLFICVLLDMFRFFGRRRLRVRFSLCLTGFVMYFWGLGAGAGPWFFPGLWLGKVLV